MTITFVVGSHADGVCRECDSSNISLQVEE